MEMESPLPKLQPLTAKPMLKIVRTMATKTSGGPIELCIKEKLLREFNPTFLEISNDSWKHASHHGIKDAENTTESHFK
jgi:BolA protein